MKFRLRAPAGLGQLVLVIGVIAGSLYLSSALAPPRQSARPVAFAPDLKPGVTTLSPQTADHRPVVSLSGVVENRTRTDIAAQVGGRVIEVAPGFARGAMVRKGELLFLIDPSDYQLALEATGAEIAAARSDLQQIRIAGELSSREWRETYPDREVPPLAAKGPQIAAAEARLMAAEASRRKAELALERTRVRAPFDARVLETQLDEGQIVNPNQIVGVIFATANVEIAAAISAAEAALISPLEGRKVSVLRPGSQAPLASGLIARRDAQLDPRTRLGRIYIALDGDSALPVGEFVSVRAEGEIVEGALQLPSTALSGRDSVFVLSGGRLARRQVSILAEADGQLMLAPFDIAEGVIVLPPPEAVEGMEVRLIAPEPAADATAAREDANGL